MYIPLTKGFTLLSGSITHAYKCVHVFTELIHRKIVNLTLKNSINKMHQKCISQNTKFHIH